MNKFIYIVLLLSASITFAHSGRTDASGCHNDNIHGGYHCHRSGEPQGLSRNVDSEIEKDDVFFNQKNKIYHDVNCIHAKACTVNCVKVKKSEALSRGGRACGTCGG